jgi:penicillin amidase
MQPDQKFGADPEKGKDEFLGNAFIQAVEKLTVSLGDDMNNWQYGQEKYKHVYIQHQLSNAVSDIWKEKLDVGPVARGGNGYTPGSTGNNNNQTSGASFRIIVDTGDWDSAIGTNTPGQSGDPDSPFYQNLFDTWANDEYFPLYYTRGKIETALAEKVILRPGN